MVYNKEGAVVKEMVVVLLFIMRVWVIIMERNV